MSDAASLFFPNALFGDELGLAPCQCVLFLTRSASIPLAFSKSRWVASLAYCFIHRVGYFRDQIVRDVPRETGPNIPRSQSIYRHRAFPCSNNVLPKPIAVELHLCTRIVTHINPSPLLALVIAQFFFKSSPVKSEARQDIIVFMLCALSFIYLLLLLGVVVRNEFTIFVNQLLAIQLHQCGRCVGLSALCLLCGLRFWRQFLR